MTGGQLYVFSSEKATSDDLAFCKLVRFFGLIPKVIEDASIVEPSQIDENFVLALSSDVLDSVYCRDWFAALFERARSVLVYGCQCEGQILRGLEWLTGGVVTEMSSVPASVDRFFVNEKVRFGGFPVSGKGWTEMAGASSVFRLNSDDSAFQTYISRAERPVFGSVRRGVTDVFLLASVKLPDLDVSLTPSESLRPWYPELIAVSIFLRSVFGDACWTAPSLGATFIIDDPYLRKRYGFIRYQELVTELESSGTALSIAFIPHNHRRSDMKTVELLSQFPQRFSIAVHGCDHTAGEFASLDESWLTATAACALDRMEDHTRRTEYAFDNVMVFPQGRFSTPGISALRRCGYDAAVNSTGWPSDYEESPLTMKDLLDVAITRYEKFPIFARRYPRDVFDHAFDALFQKPILTVEHHGYFRDGYEMFREYVRKLESLDADLAWMPLGAAVNSSCLMKRNPDGQFSLRHFTRVLQMRNPFSRDICIDMQKPEQSGEVEAVHVGGENVPFHVEAGMLRYVAHLRAGERLNVSISYRTRSRPKRKPSLRFRMAASVRRILSDGRDNYLAKSPRLLSYAKRMKSALRR